MKMVCTVWSAVLATGFFMLVAMTRAGSRLFWLVPPEPAAAAPLRAKATRAPRREVAAIVLLLSYGVIMTVAAGPLLRYTRDLLLSGADSLKRAGRVSEAASYLGIPRKKLYLRMKKHNLEKEQFKPRG